MRKGTRLDRAGYDTHPVSLDGPTRIQVNQTAIPFVLGNGRRPVTCGAALVDFTRSRHTIRGGVKGSRGDFGTSLRCPTMG